MTRPDEPVDQFVELLTQGARSMIEWIAGVGEVVQSSSSSAVPHTCAIDTAHVPGRVVKSTRVQCRTCRAWWAPVFEHGAHVGWIPAPRHGLLDPQFIPVSGRPRVAPETSTDKGDHVCYKPSPTLGRTITCPCGQDWTAVRFNGQDVQWLATTALHLDPPGAFTSTGTRMPGRLRWRTGNRNVEAERETLLFEQGPEGDRFIGEMLNSAFAQWVVAARDTALDRDSASGPADA